jgi:hypothetical protein
MSFTLTLIENITLPSLTIELPKEFNITIHVNPLSS